MIVPRGAARPESTVIRLLHEQLQLEFAPFHIFVEGLLFWRYLGGPWELVDRLTFDAP
nr:hypothetical protein [uncultured Brevundimonas sp.]